MKIAQVVIDLLKNGIVESVDDIKNEFELQNDFRDIVNRERDRGNEERVRELEKLREQISAPDFVYRNTRGQTIAVEVITTEAIEKNNYKLNKILQNLWAMTDRIVK